MATPSRERWRGPLPAGYASFVVGRAAVVARTDVARAVKEALTEGTLYRYASRHPRARSFAGRSVVWAAPLPDAKTHVVVRHSQHGGLLARLTGDRFLAPTRAPRELQASLRLAAAGVPTPDVLAYATYPAGLWFRRADVATREITRGKDLAWIFLNPPDAAQLARILAAVQQLLEQLWQCGATHPDLNLKNVLVTSWDGMDPVAYVLDVDRVTFGKARAPEAWHANVQRLVRSGRKWRDRFGAKFEGVAFTPPFEEPAAGRARR